MGQNEVSRIQSILKLSEEIFSAMPPLIPAEWLSSDITAAQLRIMMVLYTQRPSQMRSIASSVGIALSTATGVIDNLVRKGMVVRDADPQDRRLVICKLSEDGQKFINNIWIHGQEQMEMLLTGLTLEQLNKAEEVAGFLLKNISRDSN